MSSSNDQPTEKKRTIAIPASFVTSAPAYHLCPESDLPEVCLAGRSNVGKSSLINALTNRGNLAKTSNVPGKTRAMNYFLMQDSWHLVDLPGYGYAKVPKSEQDRWGKELERYLSKRKNIRLVLLLVDIRHKPQANDSDFIYFLAANQVPFALILSKADKLGKNKIKQMDAEYRKLQRTVNVDVPQFVISSEKRDGIAEIVDLINDFIIE